MSEDYMSLFSSPPMESLMEMVYLYGAPKIGKSTYFSKMPNALIIGTERGYKFLNPKNYIECVGYKAPRGVDGKFLKDDESVARRNAKEFYMDEIFANLDYVKKKTGKKPFKYIIVDTISTFVNNILAKEILNDYNEGLEKGKQQQKAANIPFGKYHEIAGEYIIEMKDTLSKYCDTIILVGHVKIKQALLENSGESVVSSEIDLGTRVKSIVTTESDANGRFFKDLDGNLCISTIYEGADALGCRNPKVAGRIFKVCIPSKTNEEGVPVEFNTNYEFFE